MPEEIKELLASPLNLTLLGAGLLVWIVWLRQRARTGPAELTQLPLWEVWWLEIILFCFSVLWFQFALGMMEWSALKGVAGEGLADQDFQQLPVVVAVLSLASPISFLLTWWVFPKMIPRRAPPPPTEHKSLGWGSALAKAVPLYLAWCPLLIVSFLVSKLLMPEAEPQSTLKAFAGADAAVKTLIVLAAAVGAPLAEELVFRGRLYRMLKSRLSMTNAAGLAALLFALVHEPLGWLSLFLFALMLTYAYERHGSLKVAIVLHALQNGATLLAMHFTGAS